MKGKRIKRLKKNKKKNLIASLLLLGVLILVTTAGTYAWLLYHDSKVNKFNTAKYNVTTEEHFTPPKNWEKGTNTQKEVWVKNNSTVPVYIRVKVIPYWESGLPLITENDEGKAINTVTLNFSKLTKWKKQGDLYYYSEPLNPGDKTEDLLESVTLSKDLPDEYSKQNFKIDIVTESIQANKQALQDSWGLNELPK